MENYYYRVTDRNGTRHSYYRKDDAFSCYNNVGIKIETVTKDLFPTITLVVDSAGFNTERIRDDMTIKKTTEALRKAVDKYDKANTVQIKMKLNQNTDADILAHLEGIENKQGYLKELIRKDMKEKEKVDN